MLKLISQSVQYIAAVMIGGMLHSCQYGNKGSYINEEASISIPGMPFSIEQAIFLNQYVNPSHRTTAWLLADSGLKSQSIGFFFHSNGKHKLCLLHWSQTDDPVWIGARVPGRFLRADLIMYESDTLVIKQYEPNGMVIKPDERYKKEVEKLLTEAGTVKYP